MTLKAKDMTSEELVKILKEKSKKGIDLARRMMLQEKIQSDVIRQAVQYYVANWEILTHPAPFILAYESVGGNPGAVAEPEAAVVMLSAALDLHDDIIDKSETKHRKQTVTCKFGPDVALLLGNAFFVKGFMLLIDSASRLTPRRTNEVLHIVKKGLFEVGDAHALELGFRGDLQADPHEYMQVLKMKAVTTQMSMQLGALLGGGTDNQVRTLSSYGRILGSLAALREEFIDTFETKELQQRIRSECLPIPILYALQDRQSKKIEKLISKKNMEKKDGMELLGLVLQSRQVQALKEEMKLMISEAQHLICKVHNSNSKTLLNVLVASMIENL
jgi:geranylgeranyl pyrophosphate synthase